MCWALPAVTPPTATISATSISVATATATAAYAATAATATITIATIALTATALALAFAATSAAIAVATTSSALPSPSLPSSIALSAFTFSADLPAKLCGAPTGDDQCLAWGWDGAGGAEWCECWRYPRPCQWHVYRERR